MPSSPFASKRYHDRTGSPYLLDRHATIGVKGKAIAYGRTETIVPIKRVYTLSDASIFEAVLKALVANAEMLTQLRLAFRNEGSGKPTSETIADRLSEAVAVLRSLSIADARGIVDARTALALTPTAGIRTRVTTKPGRDGERRGVPIRKPRCRPAD